MPRIRRKTFTGASNVFTKRDDGLAAYLQGLAQDLARTKMEVAGVPDFTDNSTGAVATALVAMTVPTVAYDGQTSGAAPGAAFNTAINAAEDALAVIGDSLNNARIRLGLPLVSFVGAVATKNTIPAMTKALSATNGATAIDFTTGTAAMTAIRNHLATVVHAYNEVMFAVGEPTFDEVTGGTPDFAAYDLTAVAAATSGTGSPAGATSIDDTVMDTFLDTLADNVASLASKWNKTWVQASVADLTDNSGGTAETPLATSGGAFALHQDGTTDSAPKAGWDAELPKIDNNLADLAAQINILLDRESITPLVDSTGGTANTTLEVIDDTLTAVDGTGSNSLENVTANATRVNVENNISTLMVEVNRLAPLFGLTTVTDNFGGTASGTKTLVATGTSGAGVDNGAAATGCADADVDAWLDRVTDAFATMAAKLNAMTGTLGDTMPTKPLKVVASE